MTGGVKLCGRTRRRGSFAGKNQKGDRLQVALKASLRTRTQVRDSGLVQFCRTCYKKISTSRRSRSRTSTIPEQFLFGHLESHFFGISHGVVD